MDLLGGIIGGIGTAVAGRQQARAIDRASQRAADTALTGYNYLTTGAGAGANGQYIANGMAANGMQADLLGLNGASSAQSQTAFNNYLNSTGYKFNLQQGTNAVASQQAASGMLNSGATGKALTQYGQNLGSQYFNNYLSQLGGLSQAGQQSLFAPANAAAGAGSAASNAIMQGGIGAADARAQSTAGLWTTLGRTIGSPSFTNALGI